MTRNLSFMLFHDKSPYPYTDLREKLIQPESSPKGLHNIMAESSIYSDTLIQSPAFRMLMPADTVLLAIICEPLSHLRAVFKEFDLGKRWGIRDNKNKSKVKNGDKLIDLDPVKDFLQDPFHYSEKNTELTIHNTQNRMAFEFGYPQWHQQYPPDDFENFLDRLNSQFKLILVFEELAESLVLLKRKLCWKTKDVLTLYQLKKSGEGKLYDSYSDAVTELELERAGRDWSATDAALYDFFQTRLAEMKLNEPNDFDKEVTWFNHVTEKMQVFCKSVCNKLYSLKSQKQLVRDKVYDVLKGTFKVEQSQWEQEFTVEASDCVQMALNSDVYRAVEFGRHFPEICGANPRAKIRKLAQDMQFDTLYCGEKGETFPFSVLTKAPLSDILTHYAS